MEKARTSIGVDGCSDGWMVAQYRHGNVTLFRFKSLTDICESLRFDVCMLDMIIGLQEETSDQRPDPAARKELKGKPSTVFPAPCRQAVYAETWEDRTSENVRILGKKLPKQTDAIIPKIREVDHFMRSRMDFRDMIYESHPEVCFARLNGAVVLNSKHTREGLADRAEILHRLIPEVTEERIYDECKTLRCQADDVADAIVLAYTGYLKLNNLTETIPEHPAKDAKGLWMMMTVPSRRHP